MFGPLLLGEPALQPPGALHTPLPPNQRSLMVPARASPAAVRYSAIAHLIFRLHIFFFPSVPKPFSVFKEVLREPRILPPDFLEKYLVRIFRTRRSGSCANTEVPGS